MSMSTFVMVTGKDGLRGVVETISAPEEGGDPQARIRLSDGRQVQVPVEVLVLQEDGSYYLPLGLAELERQRTMNGRQDGETLVVPVIVEELDVQKRTVETGTVRITKVVHDREEVVDEPLLRQEVAVQRRAINRVVEGPMPIRYEGETLIVPLLEEILVVEKRLMLTEELHITRRQVETHKPQTVTLRSEEAIVERIPGDEPEGHAGEI